MYRSGFLKRGVATPWGVAGPLQGGREGSKDITCGVFCLQAPFTIAEELILPCSIDMVEEVEGKEIAAKLKNIPLSDDTLKRRVYEMDENVEKQLISRINDSDYFSIQMDESTDVTNKALLLMFVRYCVDDSSFEDLLFCKELPTTTIADEVMKCINSFFFFAFNRLEKVCWCLYRWSSKHEWYPVWSVCPDKKN